MIPLPPLDKQDKISEYLDKQCAAIDRVIEIKKKQLEILEDLRKSIIHKAVTKGLDDGVELIDSGMELFGKIPKHWQLKRLKDVLAKEPNSMKVGPFGSDLTYESMVDEGIKVYNQRTVIDNDFMNGDFYITAEKYEKMKAFTVFPQDVLITTRGTIGRCVVVPDDAEKGILHPCLIKVKTDRTEIIPEYLTIVIQDSGFILSQLEMMSATTTIGVIYSEKLKRVYLPVPPVEDQERILQRLHSKISDILLSEDNIRNQVETLVAYRSSLIHECVTGKRRIMEQKLAQAKAYDLARM